MSSQDTELYGPKSSALGKIVVFGVLAAIAVLAARYLTFNDDRGEVKVAVLKYAAPAVEAANVATQEGRLALQKTMADTDVAVASQALLKLSRGGAAGWDAMLQQLPGAPAAIQEKVQQINFGSARYEHCARALESGTEEAKIGALIALETGNMAIMNGGAMGPPEELRGRIFESIAAMLPDAENDVKRRVTECLGRFAPTDFEELKELAANESTELRRIAVQKLGASRDKGAMDALAAMKDDADASVREAVTVAIEQLKEQSSRRRQRG
jgi:hypothetical protein